MLPVAADPLELPSPWVSFLVARVCYRGPLEHSVAPPVSWVQQ